MRIIVIAAGLGSRLGEHTDDKPKCMVEVAGQPIIEHQLDAFRDNDIHDIHIIRGYLSDKLVVPGAVYHENPNYSANNILRSLFFAEEAMEGDFMTSYSDIVYTPDVVRRAVACEADIGLVVDRAWHEAYQGREQHPVGQAELAEVRDGKVVRVGKQVGPEHALGEFIGLARFNEAGGAALREVYADVHRQLDDDDAFHNSDRLQTAYLTDLFMEMIERGIEIAPITIDGGWREIDTVEDLDRVDREWSEE